MTPSYYIDVYSMVETIPVGRVTTYGAIADALALGSARMVGWALRNMTGEAARCPAHRVVNARGELSGRHMFNPPERMSYLLIKEGVKVENNVVVDFKRVFWHPKDSM